MNLSLYAGTDLSAQEREELRKDLMSRKFDHISLEFWEALAYGDIGVEIEGNQINLNIKPHVRYIEARIVIK